VILFLFNAQPQTRGPGLILVREPCPPCQSAPDKDLRKTRGSTPKRTKQRRSKRRSSSSTAKASEEGPRKRGGHFLERKSRGTPSEQLNPAVKEPRIWWRGASFTMRPQVLCPSLKNRYSSADQHHGEMPKEQAAKSGSL
jgi:hypothetical protein